MRHNWVCAGLARARCSPLVACARSAPTPPTLPAHDRRRRRRAISPPAKHTAPTGRRRATAGDAKDPRVVDLDIIRITREHQRRRRRARADARRDRRSVQARRTRRPRPARPSARSAIYRRIVTEFPESQYAPISLFNIAAISTAAATCRRPSRRCASWSKTYPDARESIEATSTSPRCRPTTSSSADARHHARRGRSRAPNLTYADRIEAFARKGYVLIELHQLDRRRGRARSRGRRVAQRAAHRRPVLHRDGAATIAASSRTAGSPTRRCGCPTTQMIADLEPSACSRSQAYDRWKESLGLQAGVLGDRRRAIRCRRSSSSCGRRPSRRRIPHADRRRDARRSTSSRSTTACASTSRRRSRATA